MGPNILASNVMASINNIYCILFHLPRHWSTFCGRLKKISYDIKILSYLHLDIVLSKSLAK